jgi:adenylate cyclase
VADDTDPSAPAHTGPTPREVEELLLGGELRYTRLDAARIADVPAEFSDRLWRAFGYPRYSDDEVAFTEGDIAALCRLRRLIAEDVLDTDSVIRMVRAVGQTMNRLAEWQVDLLSARLLGDSAEPPSEEAIDAIR